MRFKVRILVGKRLLASLGMVHGPTCVCFLAEVTFSYLFY